MIFCCPSAQRRRSETKAAVFSVVGPTVGQAFYPDGLAIEREDTTVGGKTKRVRDFALPLDPSAEHKIDIVTVMHLSREPGYWKDRR